MEDDFDNAEILRRSISAALRVNEVLLSRLEAMANGFSGDRPLSKDEQDDLRAVHRQIAMVADFEKQLVKQETARSGGAGDELDLDAARAEIARRLDCLGLVKAARGAA